METKGIPVPKLPRNTFDLSKKRIGSMRSGLIYPVYSKIMYPNEHISLNWKIVARRLPTINPSFAEDRIILRVFKVPIRNLWDDWKSWIMGVKEYSENTPFEEDVPRWTPSDISKTGPKTLWKLLGYPVNCLPTMPPADFKRQAYAWIRDVFLRYRPLQDTCLVEGKPGTWTGEDMFTINKDRDFFTTGLTSQQIGLPVSLPITGDTSAVWETVEGYKPTTPDRSLHDMNAYDIYPTTAIDGTGANARYGIKTDGGTVPLGPLRITGENVTTTGLLDTLNNNIVSMNNISSATIDMIRTAFARQLDAEQLCRIGAFYPAVMEINWGAAPSDEIMGYPIYCGGATVNMVNSEVLQTAPSTTETPLGEMGGHGLGVGGSDNIIVTANEHSVLMVLAYIKAENYYGGQGIPIEDMFESREDMGQIAYQHLSEQKVKKQAILCASKKYPYWDATTKSRKWGNEDTTAEDYNNDTFMFMPIYQHMREATNDVFGLMIKEILYTKADGTGDLFEINNLYNWTPASFFSIKDGERPAFNEDFIQYKDDMRNYAVQYQDLDGQIQEDQYIVWMNFIVESSQVLDKYGTPGQLDHMGVI